MENHDQVDMELDLEQVVDVGGARVRCGEEHVEWDLKVGKDVAICHLDVLNFSGVRLAFESLHADELNLN